MGELFISGYCILFYVLTLSVSSFFKLTFILIQLQRHVLRTTV